MAGGENNEIFEMYGDSILNFCVMQIIHGKLGFFRTESNINWKGENGYALKGVRSESEVNAIKMNHVENQMKIKADLFEAIVGAIAVTCNFDSCGGYIPRRLRRNKGMYPTAIPY